MIAFCLIVFALSSGWLYSPGPDYLKDKWIAYFEGKSSKFLKKLSYLGICQLCSSFWIAMLIEWLYFESQDVIGYISIALVAAGVSWLLGAFTLACLWVKAYCEYEVSRRISEQNRN